MTKIDFKRELDSYKAKRGEFQVLRVPTLQYLMIDGHGDPNTDPSFAEAIGALYPVAYALKFASKVGLGRDYVVMPLEGLWWADDMTVFASGDRARWRWTLMIMQPEWTDPAMVDDALAKAATKDVPGLDGVRFESLEEGNCVQTLHFGSFADEAPVLRRLHDDFLPANGLGPAGRHHEIYLSDFRRTAPEYLRTILRQPVESRRA